MKYLTFIGSNMKHFIMFGTGVWIFVLYGIYGDFQWYIDYMALLIMSSIIFYPLAIILFGKKEEKNEENNNG